MRPYADTNVFSNVLLPQVHTREANQLLDSLVETNAPPLPIPLLLRMELINSLRRSLFEARQGKGEGILTREQVLMAELAFVQEMRLGKSWIETPVSLGELTNQFEALSHRFTPEYGFRTYDILHVASALVLGCDTFWSFDQKARKLAQLQGLKTN
jgi:predicted nucleic acid-binding protein